METVLQPPQPFIFENDLSNVTSGNLSKEWEKWKSSFMIYYRACELQKKDSKVQINILLHIIGEKCRDVFEQFKSEINTVEELLEEFDTFFLPKKNITIERHAFFTRNQREMESIEQYVFELKKIAAKCELKDLMNDLVRDRMICGIRDGTLRERLLRETDLTLSKAVDICRLAEMSRLQANNIKMEQHEHCVDVINEQQEQNNVHLVKRNGKNNFRGMQRSSKWQPPQRSNNSVASASRSTDVVQSDMSMRRQRPNTNKPPFNNNVKCEKCGINHKKYECPAYGQRCNACHRMNHYARMCRVYEIQEESSDQDSETS